MKKGAMFGLDARIALAIFGALSVISGAALYSAIQQAKVVSIVQTMNEIGKAYEQYVLDTGIGMPDESGSVTHTSAQELVENTVNATGWKGPYLSYEKVLTRSLKMTNNGLNYAFFMRAGIEDWASADGADKPCDGSRPCFIWVSIRLDDNSDLALVNAIDKYIDNSDGLNTGKFRHQNYISLLIGKSYKNTQN